MSSPIPQKKALPVFPYTRSGFTLLQAKPYQASYSKIFRAGMFTSFRYPPSVLKDGYWQNHATGGQGEVTTHEVDLHDPTYADLAALNPAGIVAHSFPENRPQLGDEYGDLDLEDRDLASLVTTIGGSMQLTSIAIDGGGLILGRFWDVVNDQAAALAAADAGKTVFVSKTDGGSGHTGKAGYLTIDDQSGVSGIVKIGVLSEIPVVGGEWGYFQFHKPAPA